MACVGRRLIVARHLFLRTFADRDPDKVRKGQVQLGGGGPRAARRDAGRRVTTGTCIGLIATSVATVALTARAPLHDMFSAERAYAYTARVAGFGERWPGSPGHKKTEDLIHQVLQQTGAQIEVDACTAKTPRGPVEVHNILGKFNVSTDPT